MCDNWSGKKNLLCEIRLNLCNPRRPWNVRLLPFNCSSAKLHFLDLPDQICFQSNIHRHQLGKLDLGMIYIILWIIFMMMSIIIDLRLCKDPTACPTLISLISVPFITISNAPALKRTYYIHCTIAHITASRLILPMTRQCCCCYYWYHLYIIHVYDRWQLPHTWCLCGTCPWCPLRATRTIPLTTSPSPDI